MAGPRCPTRLYQARRRGAFADRVELACLKTENWSAVRLQARGRLPEPVRSAKVAVVGVGALGSVLAELLGRTGVAHLALIDADTLSAGNICRHVATLGDLEKRKTDVVAARLMQVSPHLRVDVHRNGLPRAPRAVHDLLEPYDVVFPLTGPSAARKRRLPTWSATTGASRPKT